MKYFANIKSFEELKSEYRALALRHHPDVGGNVDIMKEINNEFDALFPAWKHRSNIASNETSGNVRDEFYTQNGYKGENYSPSISTKEIAQIIREYCKDVHNDYRFSVRYSSYSGGSSFSVTMTEAPAEVFTQTAKASEYFKGEAQLNQYHLDRDERITEAARAVMQDINEAINSYRMDDSDGQIDYFHTNFYYDLSIGSYDKPVKIVPREKKAATHVEYETVEVKKTRTYKTLEPREIPAPAEFAPGQMFQLKASFNYGCYRGTVYQIASISGDSMTGFIHSHKMGKGFKNVCKGQTRGNSFPAMAEKLRQWIEKGAIAFVELVEVTKTEEYTSSVRRPKKQTGISTEVRPAADTEAATQDTPEATEAKTYTVTPDTDTRDGSALWVIKFAERMSREEYLATVAQLTPLKITYSKFKKGFIARYDPTEKLAEIFGQHSPEESATHEPQEAPKASAKAISQEKISKQIESLQRKIQVLSGDYKTNTYKRMREQESRDQKIQAYNFDVQLLIYLYGISEQRDFTPLENCLLVGKFRDEFHGYYTRHKAWTETPEEQRYSAWKQVKYPEISPDFGEWYNKEVPQKQKRLNKAGIYNTKQLHATIAEYAEIIKSAAQPIDYTAQEIKRRENAARMQQKGDIQFTPQSVARRLVELSGIDSDSIVLEPSAGIGNIADCVMEVTKNVDVVEMCADFRELLTLKGYTLAAWDFLEYRPDKQYTHIIMNPPFSGNRDIEHVRHAYSLLVDGGILVAITSPHWTFASDRKSLDFRNWMESITYDMEDLSGGTFEMTGVHSKILVIHKDAQESKETA